MLEKHLAGKDYDEDASKEWVVALTEEVKARVKGALPHFFPTHLTKLPFLDIYISIIYRTHSDVLCSMTISSLCRPDSGVQFAAIQACGAGDTRADQRSGCPGGLSLPLGHKC